MIKFNRFSLITGGSSAVGKDYVRLLQCIKFEIKNCITPQILELYNTSNSCIRLKAFEVYLLNTLVHKRINVHIYFLKLVQIVRVSL